MLVVERDAPTDKLKGKHSRNTLPGHPSKKRTLGPDGSRDPSPGELACAAEEAAEEASLGAIPPEEESPRLVESDQGSPTRKMQHPAYFVSSVLRDTRERYPMMQKLLLAI